MPISDRGALVLDSEAVSLLSVRESGRMARVHAALEAAAEDDLDVVYTLEPDTILILACAHQRREPGYWLHRLSD